MVVVSVILSHVAAGVMIGYFGKKNFDKYVEKVKLKEFSVMADNIAMFYEKHGGLDLVVERRFPLHRVLKGTTDFRPPEPRPRPEFDRKKRPPKQPLDRVATVFSLNKEPIAGPPNKFDESHIFPVKVDGETVAYLGILKMRYLMRNEFTEGFIKGQANLIVATILIVLVFTILLTWLVTKKMLSPLKVLNLATKRVAERDFDVDIGVNSKDEFEDLANNFKNMVATLKDYEVKQSRWISDISHELRTPLSVIIGSLEAIQDGVRQPDKSTMNGIYQNGIRMKKLVNELHDITLAESGAMNMQKVKVDIVHELSVLVDFYSVRFAEFKTEIHFDSKQSSIFVSADLTRINQVFINILENIVKYAEKPGEVFVTCKEVLGDIAINFEDTGPGVADEHLPHLFDRLYRVDPSRNRVTGGSGLGLSICRFIIENHDGEISAYRSEKGGLGIEIKLPAESDDE